MRKRLMVIGVAMVMGAAFPAAADTLNVLWYTGGVGTLTGGTSGYQNDVNTLAGQSVTQGLNTWNVTFWDGSTALPTTGGPFNVLVVASPEGSWYPTNPPTPDYTALNNAVLNNTLSFNPLNNRIMVTGQDADYHYMTPTSSNTGTNSLDGAEGFLLDSINWAGSGTGMGLVALGQTGTNLGLSGYTSSAVSTDNITLLDPTFAVNTGLTSDGISGWSTASHDTFTNLDASQWTGINVETGTSNFVTIVSAPFADGALTPAPITTGGTVPEPSSVIGVMSLAALFFIRRKRTR